MKNFFFTWAIVFVLFVILAGVVCVGAMVIGMMINLLPGWIVTLIIGSGLVATMMTD